jgi:hypothetical protein
MSTATSLFIPKLLPSPSASRRSRYRKSNNDEQATRQTLDVYMKIWQDSISRPGFLGTKKSISVYLKQHVCISLELDL